MSTGSIKRRGRVLMVDDNADVLVTYEALLEEHFDIRTAPSSATALVALRTQEFDVIVSDHEMPGGCGAELLGRVEREFPAITGILLTGRADSDRVRTLVNDTIATGRTLVLYKPIEADVLKAWIDNGVAMARLARLKATAKKSGA